MAELKEMLSKKGKNLGEDEDLDAEAEKMIGEYILKKFGEEYSDMMKKINEFTISIKSNDSSLRLLPFNLSATIIGLSNIWNGTRVFLDENFLIPWLRNSVYKISNIKHSIDSTGWSTSFDGVCEHNETATREQNEIKDLIETANPSNNLKSSDNWYTEW